MLWICLACTTRYSVDAPECPHCGKAEHVEEGQPIPVPEAVEEPDAAPKDIPRSTRSARDA